MTTIETSIESNSPTGERADFLQALTVHRGFLRDTLEDLSDEQAAARTTVSELCLGGLIKHVTDAEQEWARFILDGAAAMGAMDQAAYEHHTASFRMGPADTVAGVLAAYAEVARRTDEIVATLPSLETAHPLPEAPWFDRAPSGAPAASCFTSSPRPHSTPGTPTSFVRRSTVEKAWAEVRRRTGDPVS